MRAVALLGPHAKQHHVRAFELPGVKLFSGNELDPIDQPDAALIFGGDGTIHRHLGGLACKHIPTLVVPLGSANDFAQSIGMEKVETALAAWRRFCSGGDNTRVIDLGTIQPLEQAGAQTDDVTPWQGESLETVHFVPDGPRRDLPEMGARIMQSQLRRRTEAERIIARTTFFSCIAGTGLDSAVNRRALKQSRWLRGHGRKSSVIDGNARTLGARTLGARTLGARTLGARTLGARTLDPGKQGHPTPPGCRLARQDS